MVYASCDDPPTSGHPRRPGRAEAQSRRGAHSPRQSGKTTLARQFVAADSPNYFDLEDPQSLARLSEPATALRPLKGLIVIDEIQRRPDLSPLVRVLADRRPLPARVLILGSASSELLKQSSESLAGRMETLPLEGVRLADLGAAAQARHWLRGLRARAR